MTDISEPNPRAVEGGNNPPDADPLILRLEESYGNFVDEAAGLELEALNLPDKPETDDDCAALVNFVAKAKELTKRVEEKRVEEKEPYLRNGQKVDEFFKGMKTPVEQRITTVTGRVTAYQRAKSEREAAERREAERREREAAEEARQRQAEADRIAREAEERQRAEAARIRSAATPEERADAEASMRDAGLTAEEARRQAEEARQEGAQAERVADSHGKAASGSVKLAKVTAEGASAGATTFWNHRVKDADKLVASLGPLGPYLANDAIMQAINAAKREAVLVEKIATLEIPGVEFFEDTRTSIRTKK